MWFIDFIQNIIDLFKIDAPVSLLKFFTLKFFGPSFFLGFFSKKQPQSSPPPQPSKVIQYPSVLTPPQNGGLETIESYQYSEVIELLSDGPIYGLVNKNGIKVNGANLFEGVYFNNSPVKETSDLNYNSFELLSNYISSIIDKSWQSSIGKEFQYSNSPTNISTNTFYVKTCSSQASLDFLNYSKSQEWLTSELSCSYQLFLTEICTPFIDVYLTNKNIDISNLTTINLNIYNLSEELYPKICSDLFSLYSYFEMPESTVSYGSISRPNLNSNLIRINGSANSNNFIRFQVWSIAKNVNGSIMPIYESDVLKKYFNFYANQNKKSLYNFNSVQVEFKNGSQYQESVKSIKNVEIDYKIQKDLIGPFKKNGSVRRLKSFLADSSRPPYTNVTLEQEGSSDLRYVRSWPVEYDINNNPYLICNITMSYSEYDNTTKNICDQDAYPYTHYVLNQNAECVYVSLSLTQLYDTTHVDLASNETSLGLNTTKFCNTELVPQGTKTFSALDYLNTATYWKKNVNPGTAGSPGAFGDSLEPKCCNFRSACQSINVGSRLPAVVSFKIETGYETDIDGSKEFCSSSYFAYRYDIFGVTQAGNVILDFGRENLNYLKYVYSYKSSSSFVPSLIHLNPYAAYDPTIETKITYFETQYKEWSGFIFLEKLLSDSFNYFNVLIAASTTEQKKSLLDRAIALNKISLFTKITEQLNIGTTVYLNNGLTSPVKDGVGLLNLFETYYIYEIIDSKITRFDTISIETETPDTPIPTQVPLPTHFLIYQVELDPQSTYNSISTNGQVFYFLESEYQESFTNAYKYSEFSVNVIGEINKGLDGLKLVVNMFPQPWGGFTSDLLFVFYNIDMELKTSSGNYFTVNKINLLKRNTQIFFRRTATSELELFKSGSTTSSAIVDYVACFIIETPRMSIQTSFLYEGVPVYKKEVMYKMEVQQVWRLFVDHRGIIVNIQPIKTFSKPEVETLYKYYDAWGNVIKEF